MPSVYWTSCSAHLKILREGKLIRLDGVRGISSLNVRYIGTWSTHRIRFLRPRFGRLPYLHPPRTPVPSACDTFMLNLTIRGLRVGSSPASAYCPRLWRSLSPRFRSILPSPPLVSSSNTGPLESTLAAADLFRSGRIWRRYLVSTSALSRSRRGSHTQA